MHSRLLAGLALALLAVTATAGANALTTVGGTEIEPGAAGSAASACPSVRPAFWGGFYAPLDPSQAAEPTGFRARGLGWRVLAVNRGQTPQIINSESYCATARRRAPVERSATVRLAPLTSSDVVARCRPGEELRAVDFRNSIDPRPGRHVIVTAVQRSGARNALVSAVNLSETEPGAATAYAYCGSARRRAVLTQGTETVAPGTVERIVAKCPGAGHDPDFSVVFGGFRTSGTVPSDGSYVYPAELRNNGGRKITLRAVNRSADRPLRVTALAYCR